MQSSKEQLKEVPEEKMISCLKAAAIALKPFPAPMHQKLKDLQAACKEHKEDKKVRHQIESVINLFIENTGIEMWNELMKQEKLVEKEWGWSFIYFLAEKLNIHIQWDQEKPDVEVVIREGKRYWRLMKGFNEVFRKENQKEFDFTTANSVRMPWERFKILKNGGKRSGNVAVTKERFLGKFEPHHRYQAAAVWEELKEKGILNEKNRLSHSWRVSSNISVKLDAITNTTEYGFTVDRFKEVVREFRKHKQVCSIENFVDSICGNCKKRKAMAEAVGQALKANYWDLRKVPQLTMQYHCVLQALNDIVHNKEYQQSVLDWKRFVPNAH